MFLPLPALIPSMEIFALSLSCCPICLRPHEPDAGKQCADGGHYGNRVYHLVQLRPQQQTHKPLSSKKYFMRQHYAHRLAQQAALQSVKKPICS
jgi:hypothetical protein